MPRLVYIHISAAALIRHRVGYTACLSCDICRAPLCLFPAYVRTRPLCNLSRISQKPHSRPASSFCHCAYSRTLLKRAMKMRINLIIRHSRSYNCSSSTNITYSICFRQLLHLRALIRGIRWDARILLCASLLVCQKTLSLGEQ